MGFEKDPQLPIETREKNIELVETNNALYRIIFSIHIIPNTPEETKGVDALVLELSGIGEYDKTNIESVINNDVYYGRQYSEIARNALLNKTPIFLVDLQNRVEVDKRQFADGLAQIVETILGTRLFIETIEEIKERKMTRRQFLKSSITMLGGFYLTLSLTPELAQLTTIRFGTQKPDENSIGRKSARLLISLKSALHPELDFDPIRENLIAQKSETIAQLLGKELNRKPTIGIVIGAGHSELGKRLKENTQKRVQFLQEHLGDALKEEVMIARIDVLPSSGTKTISAKLTLYKDNQILE